jgi:hypothetical protein
MDINFHWNQNIEILPQIKEDNTNFIVSDLTCKVVESTIDLNGGENANHYTYEVIILIEIVCIVFYHSYRLFI